MTVSFSDVKQILDDIIVAWKDQNGGREPNLEIHGPNFGWETRDQLLKSEAFGFRLIDPTMLGNNKGHQTNLVIALRDPNGVQFLGRMPQGGPFLEQTQIDNIVEWLNDGAPEEASNDIRNDVHDVSQSVEMLMRDPDVNQQSDLAPYPNGPGKLLHKWKVSVGFNTAIPSPIQIRVTGISGGSAGIRPGNVFDGIQANNAFQDTEMVFEGNNTQGCMVLQNASIEPTSTPPYDPTADLFPDPAEQYEFHHMAANGRWFLVNWNIKIESGTPNLELTAEQQPRVNSVEQRKCP